jgi:hypothetical protein
MTDPIRLRYRIRDRIPRTNGRTNEEGSNHMRTNGALVTRTKGSTNGSDSTHRERP